MSDFRSDPNFPRGDMQQYDSRVQWAAVAVILLLLGGLIVAASFTGDQTQSASTNSPAVETTGSGGATGAAQTMDRPPRQLRH